MPQIATTNEEAAFNRLFDWLQTLLAQKSGSEGKVTLDVSVLAVIAGRCLLPD
ncbi:MULTISPECIES: hypothetical protein [unclassified Endozoicomonas]|uniref:hypothetical protein n=1 Tax=unclassified Endozoicomonas TaxID=2644528 RepID=UPI003BB5736B